MIGNVLNIIYVRFGASKIKCGEIKIGGRIPPTPWQGYKYRAGGRFDPPPYIRFVLVKKLFLDILLFIP